MQKMTRALLVGALLLEPFGNVATFARSKAAIGSAPRKSAGVPFSPASYAAANAGLNCANLGERFASAMPVNRAWAALARNPKVANGSMGDKGEFETTAAYHERIDGFWARELGGIDLIVVENSLGAGDASYNADTGMMTIIRPIRYVKHYSEENRLYESGVINVFFETISNSDYTGTNAFGVSQTVYKSTSVHGELSVPVRYKLESAKYKLEDYIVEIPMSIAEAKGLSANGKIFVLAKKMSPFVVDGVTGDKPTLGSPLDMRTYRYGFNVEPMCMAVTLGNRNLAKFDFYDSSIKSDPSPAEIVYLPKPQTNPNEWLSASDYPSRAERMGKSGTVGFKLTVGYDGRVTDCKITTSTGSLDLDEATCRLIPRRAQFKRADETNGRDTKGVYVGTYVWRLSAAN
ncbi:energy transducer TonB [Sphingobium sp. HT1-2]|uniref:energy transducer TonB n=1 Tax=Sphingobium sp. HT1-2 TaxID=3111640 RepID=UPI003C0BE2B0